MYDLGEVEGPSNELQNFARGCTTVLPLKYIPLSNQRTTRERGNMAEFAIKTAVEKLTNLIIQEAVLLKGVSENVEQLRNELSWMQSFLQDAEGEQERNERFRIWVSQVREVAYDAEDVIETYITKVESKKSRWHFTTKSIHSYKVVRKIKQLQSRIQHISTQRQSYGITREGAESSTNERLKWWRQPSPHIEEDGMINLAEDTLKVVQQLRDLRCFVIPIVGMGGLGKTTLAKTLYNNNDVGHLFDCKAFVYVSKDYKRKETLHRIIKDVSPSNIGDDLEKLEEEEMIIKLRESLKERKYLVVLDDIWTKEAWDSLKDAFPRELNGSKVILTTRSREVAVHADARSIPHEPRMLTEDESFELLCKKALLGMDDLPSDLEKLGREMVVKCGGLPLAVVVLGGLLSTKTKTAEEWRRVLQNIRWRLICQDHISAILGLSYTDLPFYLKSCFLHLGLFPEDFSIWKTYLMRLWIAEGFLPQQGEESAEGVAENCFYELIDRCMIQVETVTSFGRAKTIRIHDLLRDFSVSKGKEENFLGIYTGQDVAATSASQATKYRRLAIHAHYDQYSFLNPYAPHLRSLHFFSGEHPKTDFISMGFKLLRVLDLYLRDQGFQVVSIPSAVGNLIQLRYLGLTVVSLCKLPPSIGNLKNLQTLDLRCSSPDIPDVIWKMEHLRHLLLDGSGENLRLDTLSHLQTLEGIQAGRWIECGLPNMINLRRLEIRGLLQQNVESVIDITHTKLHHLQSLSLSLMESEVLFPSFPLSILTDIGDHPHLYKLCLKGVMRSALVLLHAHSFLGNLVKLSLFDSNLQEDSIVMLEVLPSLKMLVLGEGSIENGCTLVCSSGGFPQLQVLHLLDLNFDRWIVEQGAMLRLKHLKISYCPNLKEVPEGFKFLTNLKEIELFGMALDFHLMLPRITETMSIKSLHMH